VVVDVLIERIVAGAVAVGCWNVCVVVLPRGVENVCVIRTCVSSERVCHQNVCVIMWPQGAENVRVVVSPRGYGCSEWQCHRVATGF